MESRPFPAADVLDPSDRRPEITHALDAWLALQERFALDPMRAVELLNEHGAAPTALRALGAEVDPRAVAGARKLLRGAGAVAVPYSSNAYPARLRALVDAPPLLLVRGDASALGAPAVAIVGSRACTAYGRAVARHFASELARAGLVIVSGLAYGIDAAAHRAALDAGGRSVAVSACGIDRTYPAEHRGLASKIAASGALVSEFPPATHPRREFFPLRNRLISGMSMALLVVEARERSGSLVTARHAANQGITVFAVPGPIDAATSRGTNRLLREGAWVATEPADLLAELGSSAASPAEQHARGVDDRGRAILDALRDAPATRDELARRLGASAAVLALPLLELELTRHVEEDRDGQLRVVASRSEL
ncbi:MAG: DNA-protecting protein DprA [Myxococcales bacterium]|nr:DNA-protecting protein DprA [Myxococcales bacterium]